MKPEPAVNNFWRSKLEFAQMLSNYILAGGDSYGPIQQPRMCQEHCTVKEFCWARDGGVFLRGMSAAYAVGGHVSACGGTIPVGTLMGWRGRDDVSSFCLFCGSCNGLSHTRLTHSGKVHSNCRVAHTKLHVSKAAKAS